jgi:hypothetical protein
MEQLKDTTLGKLGDNNQLVLIERGSAQESQETGSPVSPEELRKRADILIKEEENIAPKSERRAKWRKALIATSRAAALLLAAIPQAYAGQATNPESMTPQEAYCEMLAGKKVPGYRMERKHFKGYEIEIYNTLIINEKTGDKTIVRRQSPSGSSEVVCPLTK